MKSDTFPLRNYSTSQFHNDWDAETRVSPRGLIVIGYKFISYDLFPEYRWTLRVFLFLPGSDQQHK